jgi:hypothetical protein
VHPPPEQHGCPLPPQEPQVPDPHVEPVQQPEHDAPLHTQSPLTHCWPLPQRPFSQTPPQPSSAPQALPLHVGTHPQAPGCPPPLHESGDAHMPPPQHVWPLPPHVPQSTPHVWPLPHGAHATPPWPHDVSSTPLSQVVPLQQPAHDVTSHRHSPDTQRCPCPHAPRVQTPSQPLLAPHALLEQLGVHGPEPHTVG